MNQEYPPLIALIVAAILVYAFWPIMASLGGLTLVSFIICCGLSLYKGVVFEQPEIVGFIAVGHVLTNTATKQVLPMVFENLASGLLLQALIIGIVFVVMYVRGKEVQIGDV